MSADQFNSLIETIEALRTEQREEWEQQRKEATDRLERLVTIEANMKILTGNGKPGKITEMEAKLEDHGKVIDRIKFSAKLLSIVGLSGILGYIRHLLR